MIIKRKLEGRAKLRVWDEHMHTNRYQIDNEKDLLNTTGNSMGKKPAVSYIRKKTEEQINVYVHLNQIHVNLKQTKHWNWKSALFQYKISINYKLNYMNSV